MAPRPYQGLAVGSNAMRATLTEPDPVVDLMVARAKELVGAIKSHLRRYPGFWPYPDELPINSGHPVQTKYTLCLIIAP